MTFSFLKKFQKKTVHILCLLSYRESQRPKTILFVYHCCSEIARQNVGNQVSLPECTLVEVEGEEDEMCEEEERKNKKNFHHPPLLSLFVYPKA